jgi:hypothetical protein
LTLEEIERVQIGKINIVEFSRGKENVRFYAQATLLMHSAAKDERPEPRRHLNG